MNGYLVHTKPRQEMSALENLHQQGYLCCPPAIPSENLCRGLLTVAGELRHGANLDSGQTRHGACSAGQFAQGELINLLRFCQFGKNHSQSHDGVAEFKSSVELAALSIAALYCSGLPARPTDRAC